MSSRTLINQKGGKFVVLFTANTELAVASANSGIAGETVTGLHINQIWYGLDTGFWKINRGANTINIYDASDYIDYAGSGLSLQIDAAANVVVNCTSANCTLIIDFQKVSSFTSEY